MKAGILIHLHTRIDLNSEGDTLNLNFIIVVETLRFVEKYVR